MGIELCESCVYYEAAAFPDITPHIHGYCMKLEWPFNIAMFKEEREGAMTPPESKCDVRKERKKGA